MTARHSDLFGLWSGQSSISFTPRKVRRGVLTAEPPQACKSHNHDLYLPIMANFKGFWHGPPLGPIRRACLETFLRKGHTFTLYAYDVPNDLPSGVVLGNASQVIPISNIFYYRNPFSGETGDLGPFSDLFRFKLLSQEGGWWTDVDTLCLSANIGSPDYAWAQEQPEINKKAIGTSQIAMPAGSRVINTLYHECLKLSMTQFQPREALGPHLLSKTISLFGLERNTYGSPNSFYPIRWIEIFKLWLPEYREEVMQRAETAYFMPIYQSYPKYIGLDVLALPPSGSYLDLALQKGGHIGSRKGGNQYDADEIRNKVREFFKRNNKWAPQELESVAGRSCANQLLKDA